MANNSGDKQVKNSNRAKGKQRHTQKPSVPKDLVKKEYTDEEKARIAKYLDRSKRKLVKFKSGKDASGKPCLVCHLTDETLSLVKLAESFGTPDIELQLFLLNQVVATFKGCLSSEGIDNNKTAEFSNTAMALLNGIQPQDEIEGMLAVQMIAVHNMAMETMKLAMITGQTFEGKEANVNRATKMLRTFAAQMEALKRYRTGGQQKVIVEHVYVTAGGQAIVGVVNRGEGNSGKRG
jgi:hypothetical protein